MFSLSNALEIDKKNVSLVYRIYYAFLCSGCMSTLLGVILPYMQSEYGMSYTLSGTVLSAHQIGNLCAVIVAGFLPYAIGRKQSTLIMSFGTVLGLTLMTLTGNPLLLILAFAFTGIGRGTLSNITNVVVSENAGNRTAGLNILHSCFAIGAFVSPFVAIAVSKVQWRIAAWIFAFTMLLAWILIGTSTLSSKKVEKAKSGDYPFYKSFDYWLNTFILFFYLCAEGSLTGWLVTYFKDTGLMPISIAQTMQSVLWIMILLGRLTCAFLAGRVFKAGLILFLGLMMSLSFVLMIVSDSLALIIIGLLGVGFFMSGIYPTTFSTMSKNFNSSTVATGTCIGTATLGAIIMPIIIGAVADRSGIAGGIATLSGALFCMVLLMVVKFFRNRKEDKV